MSANVLSALRRRGRGYWRLSPAERSLVRQSALLLSTSALLLKFLRLQSLVQRLERLLPAPDGTRPGDDTLARAEHIAHLFVSTANHHPLPTTCLPRAVALWWLLRRARIEAHIVLGVQPPPSGFTAHAWVESAGRVVGDPQQAHLAYSTILAVIPRHQ